MAEASRSAMTDVADASRKVFDAWATGVEVTLQATFDAENAALETGIAVLAATTSAERKMLEEWNRVARQAQQAALDAFRTSLRAAHQAGDASKR